MKKGQGVDGTPAESDLSISNIALHKKDAKMSKQYPNKCFYCLLFEIYKCFKVSVMVCMTSAKEN